MENTKKPECIEYFKNGLAIEKKMIDVPISVLFKCFNAGHLNFTTDINIHGAGYLSKKNIAPGNAIVDIAVATSDFFKTFNDKGELVAALRISFNGKEPVKFEKRTDIRVDGGQFVVCDLDYVAHIGELQEKMGLPEEKEDFEDEDIYGLLGQGKVPGSSMQTGVSTEHSIETIVDGRKTIEIKSGYGDGTYPLWFGYDESDALAAAYVDFMLFERHDVIEQIIQGK